LIETQDAVRNAAELARLPLSRVYVGLQDLAIDRFLRWSMSNGVTSRTAVYGPVRTVVFLWAVSAHQSA
ncbi:MAG: hypothetical protein AABO41_28705, partial [Acidobacteriota bacterium]